LELGLKSHGVYLSDVVELCFCFGVWDITGVSLHGVGGSLVWHDAYFQYLVVELMVTRVFGSSFLFSLLLELLYFLMSIEALYFLTSIEAQILHSISLVPIIKHLNSYILSCCRL
jgi:hypothetical protein